MVGGGHFRVKPNRCVEARLRLGWGFDNNKIAHVKVGKS